MRHLTLVFVFAVCLFLKASTVAGAVAEYSEPIEIQDNNNNNNNNNNNSAAAASAAAASTNPQIYNYSYAPPPPPPPLPGPQNQATRVENNNNITFGPQSPVVQGQASAPGSVAEPAVAYGRGNHYYNGEEASDVIQAHEREEFHEHTPTTVTPMIGGAWYAADWSRALHNSYSLGLGVEFPLSYLVSIEAETGYSRYTMDYLTPNPINPRVLHTVNQFNFGGNFKLYLTRTTFRPYLGAGLMGLYYDGMVERHLYYDRYFSQMIGAGQLLAGSDLCLGSGVALGVRGAWVVPLFNRPQTYDNGVVSLPPYQEASAINTSFYKLMGTVSVTF